MHALRRGSELAETASERESSETLNPTSATSSAQQEILARAAEIAQLSMASAAELVNRLDRFNYGRKHYGDNSLDQILILMVFKAYFIHLALLRLQASSANEDLAAQAYAKELDTYLRYTYALEFKTTRQLVAEKLPDPIISNDPLPKFDGCPMVIDDPTQTTADQRLLEIVVPRFFTESVQSQVLVFLRERLPRFTVRFLSNM